MQCLYTLRSFMILQVIIPMIVCTSVRSPATPSEQFAPLQHLQESPSDSEPYGSSTSTNQQEERHHHRNPGRGQKIAIRIWSDSCLAACHEDCEAFWYEDCATTCAASILERVIWSVCPDPLPPTLVPDIGTTSYEHAFEVELSEEGHSMS